MKTPPLAVWSKTRSQADPGLCELFHHQQIICYSRSYVTTWCWIFSHNIVHYLNFIWQVRRVPAVALKSVGFSSLCIILIVFFSQLDLWTITSNSSYQLLCQHMNEAFLRYCAIMESIEQNCHKQQWCLPLWVNCQVWWIRLFFLCRVSLLKWLWGSMSAE